MQTPTHLIISAALGPTLGQKANDFRLVPFLFGGILPDIPFAFLTLAGGIYYRELAPLPAGYPSIMEYLHFELFFSSPWWIIPHNFFHSVVVLGILMAVGWLGRQTRYKWGNILFWLSASAMLHTILDILTHTTDGPLFLFPINWTYRFASPISYWETGSFGQTFIFFEFGLNLILLVYLWRQRKRLHLRVS